jgi:dipeptidyl aminopeptidase/acylaminoacyl peptidase
MLFARGADDEIEVVDTSGVNKPITLSLRGNSRPVWVQSDGSFYLTASSDQGATWACWRVTPAGSATECGAATTDVASSGGGLALIVKAGDGSYHLAYAAVAGGLSTPLTSDPSFSEAAPSFSPNGSAIAFGRVSSQSPGVSAGIWTIDTDGTGLTILTTDGASPRWIP